MPYGVTRPLLYIVVSATITGFKYDVLIDNMSLFEAAHAFVQDSAEFLP